MLKIRYPPRFAVIRAGQCACGASGPADMRLQNGASHPLARSVRRIRPRRICVPGR